MKKQIHVYASIHIAMSTFVDFYLTYTNTHAHACMCTFVHTYLVKSRLDSTWQNKKFLH